ncbi:MAG: carbohydrate ABC transporter permease [Clostridia bacterium]|nr:carbohydrate ABC transporter permease [Clostridia bacterium]
MRRKRGARFALICALLFILTLVMLLPMIQTFLYSFSSIEDMKAYMKTRGSFDGEAWMESRLSPAMFSLGQYYQILITDNTVLRLFVNSAGYTLLILLGQALVIPAMAFALSRFRFPGRDALFFAIILLMLLPFQVTMVPNVLTLRSMGLLNTVWSVILPMWFSPFYIFLIRQFMVGLPGELIEAASIDGAGTARVYLNIILPVCRPILGAAAALSFADCWNLVEQPLTYLAQRDDLQPLSTMFNQLAKENTGFEFAGAALYILPALFVYMFFQSDILSGIQLTEMK